MVIGLEIESVGKVVCALAWVWDSRDGDRECEPAYGVGEVGEVIKMFGEC